MADPVENQSLGEPSAAEGDSQAGLPASKKKKKRVRFKLSFRNIIQWDPPEEGDGVEPVTLEKPQKLPKPKKEKRPKAKRPKRQKPVKVRGEKKRRPVALIVVAALIVIAGIVCLIVLLTRGESVEQRLERAMDHTAEGAYQDAAEIYSELLLEDLQLVDAYLGQADNYLAQGNRQDAVIVLEQGYTVTEDGRIGERLEALRPEDGEEPEEEVPGNEPIVWQDAALERMVRLAIPSLPATVTPADLEGVTSLKIVGATHAAANAAGEEALSAINTLEGYTIDDALYTQRGEIRSLDDLQHFRNLTKLVVCYNQVEDIGGIAGLTGLETLGLYFNQVSDLSALSGLTNLQYLYLYGNSIADLSPLSGLGELRALYLQYNQITSIGAIAGMLELRELYVGHNAITDISPVAGLGQLRYLYADSNQIGSIEVVAQVPSLTDVNFRDNPVADLSPASGVQNVN